MSLFENGFDGDGAKFLFGRPPVSVLGTMYRCYKEWKFCETEWREYAEAKKMYLEKIEEERIRAVKLEELV